MSTRYVWNRFNRALAVGQDPPGIDKVDLGGTERPDGVLYVYTTTNPDNFLGSSPGDRFNIKGYNNLVPLNEDKTVKIPAGTYFWCDSYWYPQLPYGELVLLALEDLTVRNNGTYWSVYEGKNSNTIVVSVWGKGTANGTVSNRSSGAYQLDTSGAYQLDTSVASLL